MCRHLKQDAKTASIPIILLTAKNDDKTELDSIKMDVEQMISKPFDSKIFLSRVEQLLRNKAKVEEKLRLESLTALENEVSETSFDEQMLSKITKIIEDNLSDPEFNVETLSSLAGYHSKQIYRKLKQLIGLTTVEYLKSIRVKKPPFTLAKKKSPYLKSCTWLGSQTTPTSQNAFVPNLERTPNNTSKNKKTARKTRSKALWTMNKQ